MLLVVRLCMFLCAFVSWFSVVVQRKNQNRHMWSVQRGTAHFGAPKSFESWWPHEIGRLIKCIQLGLEFPKEVVWRPFRVRRMFLKCSSAQRHSAVHLWKFTVNLGNILHALYVSEVHSRTLHWCNCCISVGSCTTAIHTEHCTLRATLVPVQRETAVSRLQHDINAPKTLYTACNFCNSTGYNKEVGRHSKHGSLHHEWCKNRTLRAILATCV